MDEEDPPSWVKPAAPPNRAPTRKRRGEHGHERRRPPPEGAVPGRRKRKGASPSVAAEATFDRGMAQGWASDDAGIRRHGPDPQLTARAQSASEREQNAAGKSGAPRPPSDGGWMLRREENDGRSVQEHPAKLLLTLSQLTPAFVPSSSCARTYLWPVFCTMPFKFVSLAKLVAHEVRARLYVPHVRR